MRRIHFPVLFAISMLLAGCSSAYLQDYFYAPHPVVKSVATTQASEPAPVSSYAAVIGIRTADKKLDIPESVEIRLRIDNNGTQMVRFNSDSMRLTTGALVRFPAPLIDSKDVSVSPGETALITAEFPFPGGQSYKDFDLHTLILHWVLHVGKRQIVQTAQFHRQFPRVYYYGDPYWDYPYYYPPGPYFGGVVIVHRHWRH